MDGAYGHRPSKAGFLPGEVICAYRDTEPPFFLDYVHQTRDFHILCRWMIGKGNATTFVKLFLA